MSDQQLAEELHKPTFIKFKKRKVYSTFIDKICVAHFADIQLISKFDKGLRFYYVELTFIANMHGLFL